MKICVPAPLFLLEQHRLRLFWLCASLLLLASAGVAQDRAIRVARVSLVEGDVNYQRAQDKRDEWFDATANLPLDENDQVYTSSNGRTEIQLTGGNLIRLNRDTNLRVSQFNNGTMQFALSIGSASFRIGSLDRRQLQLVDAKAPGAFDNDQPIYFEVDTPVVAVTLLREGNYRINVGDDGTTEVIVRRGKAEVYNKDLGTIQVSQDRRIIVEGSDPTLYQIKKLDDKDEWDRWNDRRDEELFARAGNSSARYVPLYLPGVYDLDQYGDWFETPDYGWVWSPRAIAGGWAPYRSGCWRWYPSYGWTWIAHEPWGWVPYHYGRWAYWGSRWCWVPRIDIGFSFGWSWSPALVAFYGTRGNYGRGYRDGFSDGYRRGYRNGAYDWIGWVPLAPGEHAQGQVAAAGSGPVVISRADSLRNFSAPGGVSGVEGGMFEHSRVVVHNATVPPRPPEGNRAVDFVPVRGEQVKPTEPDTPRAVQLQRTSTGRDLSAPVVVRRPADSNVQPSGLRPSREATVTPAGTSRVPEPSSVERAGRPTRAPDFRPAERPVAPSRSTESRTDRDRNAPAGTVVAPEREQRYSPPPGRSESPRQVERHESPPPPRPERAAPPPERSRESAPPPRTERSAPAPERSAPAKESAPPPSRPERAAPAPERSREAAPSRKPDNL